MSRGFPVECPCGRLDTALTPLVKHSNDPARK